MLTRRRTLVVDFTVMNVAQRSVVNGFEGRHIGGVGFGHVAPVKHSVIHHHQHATVGRGFIRRCHYRVIEVERTVRAHSGRRTHCANQHYRLVALHGQIEEVSGLFHGVSTVGNHEAVGAVTLVIDLFRQG